MVFCVQVHKTLVFLILYQPAQPGTRSCIPERVSGQKHKGSRINQLCPPNSLCSVGKPWSLLSCLRDQSVRITSAYGLLVNLLCT